MRKPWLSSYAGNPLSPVQAQGSSATGPLPPWPSQHPQTWHQTSFYEKSPLQLLQEKWKKYGSSLIYSTSAQPSILPTAGGLGHQNALAPQPQLLPSPQFLPPSQPPQQFHSPSPLQLYQQSQTLQDEGTEESPATQQPQAPAQPQVPPQPKLPSQPKFDSMFPDDSWPQF
jgi:hypothetical protein